MISLDLMKSSEVRKADDRSNNGISYKFIFLPKMNALAMMTKSRAFVG